MEDRLGKTGPRAVATDLTRQTMQIKSLELAEVRRLIPGLVRLYNEQIAAVPYCYPIEAAEMERVLSQDCEDLSNERIIVCEDNGDTIGFAHVAEQTENQRSGPGTGAGQIRCLMYRRGNRSAGQALLDEAEAYCRRQRLNQVGAFHYAYPFHRFGAGALSDKLGHVRALLQGNGFTVAAGWLFLALEEYSADKPTCPDPAVEVDIQQEARGGERPGYTVRAFRAGQEIGHCIGHCGGDYVGAKAGQDALFISRIGVEEEGKGLGTFLMKETLWHARGTGYRNVLLYTNLDNARAQLFYANMGFGVIDTIYKFGKILEGDDSPEGNSVERLQHTGEVVGLLSDELYEVELEEGKRVVGFKSEAMGQYGIQLGLGDTVVLETYSREYGRIVFRN